MRMDGIISSRELLARFDDARRDAARLIQAEVPAIIEAAKRTPLTLAAPSAPVFKPTPAPTESTK